MTSHAQESCLNIPIICSTSPQGEIQIHHSVDFSCLPRDPLLAAGGWTDFSGFSSEVGSSADDMPTTSTTSHIGEFKCTSASEVVGS